MKLLLVFICSFLIAEDIYQNIKGSSHDFSFGGENSCIYCHTSEDMKIDEPSLLCLSCHDGVSSSLSSNNQHSGLLGFTDAGNHPVSIRYELKNNLKHIQDPTLLKNGMVECTSCHNPHQTKKDQSVNFLRYPMKNSKLCYQCHSL